MASLIQLIVSNYNEVLKNGRDPTLDTWLLMESPNPILWIVGLYLIFVLKVGPKMMDKRPAFQLNTVMILYNAFQVLFSIWLVTMVFNIFRIRYLLFIHGYNIKNNLLPSSQNANLNTLALRVAWWYFVAKITELLDTVFFVLRKKKNQITFLHVYHHTFMVIFSWCYLKFMFCEEGIIIGLLNSMVHVIMYSYYLIAALGPKYKKYLWWKRYMTCIQLLQFTLMLIYLILTLVVDNQTPRALSYFFAATITIFLYLFTDFYRQEYKKKIVKL